MSRLVHNVYAFNQVRPVPKAKVLGIVAVLNLIKTTPRTTTLVALGDPGPEISLHVQTTCTLCQPVNSI